MLIKSALMDVDLLGMAATRMLLKRVLDGCGNRQEVMRGDKYSFEEALSMLMRTFFSLMLILGMRLVSRSLH